MCATSSGPSRSVDTDKMELKTKHRVIHVDMEMTNFISVDQSQVIRLDAVINLFWTFLCVRVVVDMRETASAASKLEWTV